MMNRIKSNKIGNINTTTSNNINNNANCINTGLVNQKHASNLAKSFSKSNLVSNIPAKNPVFSPGDDDVKPKTHPPLTKQEAAMSIISPEIERIKANDMLGPNKS